MKNNKKIKFTLLIISMLSLAIFLTSLPTIFMYAMNSNGVTTSYMHDDKKLIEEDFYKSQAFDEAVMRPIIGYLNTAVTSEKDLKNNEKKELDQNKKRAKENLSNLSNVEFIVINKDTNEYYTNTSAKDIEEFEGIVAQKQRKAGCVVADIVSEDKSIQYNKTINTKLYTKMDSEGRLASLINIDNIHIQVAVTKNIASGDWIYRIYKGYQNDVLFFKVAGGVSFVSLIVCLLSIILYKLSKVELFSRDSFAIKVLNKIPIELRLLLIPVVLFYGFWLVNSLSYIYYDAYYYDVVYSIVFSILYLFIVFMLIYISGKQIKSIKSKDDIINQSLIVKILILSKKILKNLNERRKNILQKRKDATTKLLKSNQNMPLIKRVMIIVGIGIVANTIISFICVLLWASFEFVGAIIAMILSNVVLVGLAYLLIKKLAYLSDIIEGAENIKNGNLSYKIEVKDNDNFTTLAQNINNIGEGLENSIDKQLRSERMKSELITNVSHDLKTPLTSIINYIDLIKDEKNIQPEYINDYVNVLDSKSKRLKSLIEDLFEASKASSGNIELNIERIEFDQLIRQAIGEVEERLLQSNLDIKLNIPKEKIHINADGKRLYRVLENLLSNIAKYSLSNTRVYIDVTTEDQKVKLVMKNISSYELNFDAEEIVERFKRGDESRNTEGSGLGLAIAKDLVNIQGGNFDIDIDGDLFKVTIEFFTV
ncbi:HAMP domain-containing sensor histidine kinase [Romboutsia lituseburensis]|uniref:histidine kinase n=1 Tax=Romboutsia lituseburensis DSM 797 TaxID=1121325 RepID=A0A1G9IK47_9FIRM|nr:sensor histidine kinase [Romboutsia lituseburensis]CEH33859.1 Sensory transduction protein kinase [Romboutsia lituseburensis]SDL25609.1 Histidine kinase-, DNA gyrase B-, and HSP90-like ATPase [Romboutsia lituseburensis DSM 797]